jgi:hypothetical protein
VSDERVRELERRWRETGVVEDEAALLRERVRAGVLAGERVALAAYLGHEAARVASPSHGGGAEPASLSLAVWLKGLERHGRETLHRAASVVGGLPWLREVRAGEGLPGTTEFSRAVFAALNHDECDPAFVVQSVREHLVPWVLGVGDVMQRRHMLQIGPRKFTISQETLTGEIVDRRRPDVGLELEVQAAASSFDGERFEPKVYVDLARAQPLKVGGAA